MSYFQYPIVGRAEKFYATRLLFDWGEGTECIYVYSRLRFDELYPFVCRVLRGLYGHCDNFKEEMGLDITDIVRHIQAGRELFSTDDLLVYLKYSIDNKRSIGGKH